MLVTSWRNPTANTLIANNGEPLVNPSNAYIDDNAYATVSALPKNTDSDKYRFTGFGFTSSDIPSGSTILGIQASIRTFVSSTSSSPIATLNLYRPTTTTETSSKVISYTSTSEVAYVLPNSVTEYRWDTDWSYSDIVGNSDFGISIYFSHSSFSGTRDYSLDEIALRIFYTTNTTATAYSGALLLL
ncbi:hypothetical protein [Picosynechococcus sp. PCC 7117]|uniref:hypothetical protein n=1 Tax=Picosynechococcus sp. PCC 7117 TaxID=195498 RepID=UPI0012ED2FDC|nr:hypothetical protein [Picosynechococcus sp. PCC 7117]